MLIAAVAPRQQSVIKPIHVGLLIQAPVLAASQVVRASNRKLGTSEPAVRKAQSRVRPTAFD